MQAVGMWLASVLVPLGGMRLTLTIVVRDRHGPERQAFCPNLVPEDFSPNPWPHGLSSIPTSSMLVPSLSFDGTEFMHSTEPWRTDSCLPWAS